MSKLPVGPPNVHIQKSQGADTNIMKFYITQNSTTYGARFENFQPHQATHRGTGYLSNYRPGVYYNRRLDDVDNPSMRRICDGNYRSVTQLDYQPYRDPSGLEVFPINVIHGPSGFVRGKLRSVTLDRQGPPYMTTETQEKFKAQPLPNIDLSTKDIGPVEPSGFVSNQNNEEPITYQPMIAHKNLKPGWCTHRPTGVSITRTSYLPKTWSRGDDPLPGGISHGSERGTGFTREAVKPKYTNLKASDTQDRIYERPYLKGEPNKELPDNSISHDQFKGMAFPLPTEADRLNRTSVGWKEGTGFVRNNAPYMETTDDKMRFMTHYMSRFGPDPTPIGVDRAGHLSGGIQEVRSNGFIKSTAITDFGKDVPSTEVLHKIEPYVGRSLKARNVFFDDHTYNSKISTQLIA